MVEMPSLIGMIWAQVHRESWRRLTKAQRDFLEAAARWTDTQGFDGHGARGARIRTATKLEGLGLVEYVGHGMCEDDSNGDADTPIYAVTDKGRDLLNWWWGSEQSGTGEP